MFGQAIIAILILLGGIGIFALKVYIFNFILGRKLNLSTSNLLDKERSSKDASLSKKTIIVSISLIFILIALSSFILSFVFYFELPNEINIKNNPVGDIGLSIRFAVFHSISAINNAGFDIIGSSSLAPYYTAYTMQLVFMVLFIIGGIGYPVIYDTYSFLRHKVKRLPGKAPAFSLFSKISCISYLAVSVIGLILAFSFETTSMRSLDGDEVSL
jgi:Trk-type K+ transport system membrane component